LAFLALFLLITPALSNWSCSDAIVLVYWLSRLGDNNLSSGIIQI
jgi:hypothetical protein